MFAENGYKYQVLDRYWLLRDLKVVTVAVEGHLSENFPVDTTVQLMLCNNCYKICRTINIPPMMKHIR